MDMGNIIHQALEEFAVELRQKQLNWRELSDEERDTIAINCLVKLLLIMEIRFCRAVQEITT